MPERDHEVLVETVEDEHTYARVRLGAVHEKKALEEAELPDGVVRRRHRLDACTLRKGKKGQSRGNKRFRLETLRECVHECGTIIFTTGLTITNWRERGHHFKYSPPLLNPRSRAGGSGTARWRSPAPTPLGHLHVEKWTKRTKSWKQALPTGNFA